MTTILFNESENKKIGNFREGYYTVDGIRPELPEGIVELTVRVELKPTEYNPKLHELHSYWKRDGEYYVKKWNLIDLGVTIGDLKGELNKDLDRVQDEFAVLISRCHIKSGYDNPYLNAAIEDARQMIATTEANIEALSTIDEALAFHIRPEDVEYYKSLFEPFK